ncbi:MAG: NAD-dependent succinate-semialdehyde dehydrogenase [Pseudomonadota bacterium]
MHQMINKILQHQCYVNGQWIGESIDPVSNPATGKEIAKIPHLGAHETRQAIEAASSALQIWKKILPKERSGILRKWFDLQIEHRDELAHLVTLEQGKPLAEARAEVTYGASFVEFYAEEAKRINGDVLPAHRADGRNFVLKQPIGVVGAITPWNFPHAMITRKVAPALAAGCTVVCKPAPDTPLTALALAHLAQQAGFPDGVFNVITGDAQAIGEELTSNPLVRMIAFTGSTAVGKLLMGQCAQTVKRVALELGGNAPFIIFDDADMDKAINAVVASKFRNAGQTCVCANRIFVHDKIYDEFAQLLSVTVENFSVGEGLDANVNIGPLINTKALEKVEHHVENATQKGASILTGGARHDLSGNFYQPTVLSGVTTDMQLAKEETFGPVAGLFRFSSEDDVVAEANNTTSGLAAYVCTENISRIWRMAEDLEYGIVSVNEGVFSNELAPFGGMKESGLGREGSHYGIEEFLELKFVFLGGLS